MRKINCPNISREDVAKWLVYDPRTGVFTWVRPPRNNKTPAGPAGSRRHDGYVTVQFNGHRILAHRLAWFVSTGTWPMTDLDHRNGDPSDNRLSNLRLATHSENIFNRGIPSNNTSGFRGVTWHASRSRWAAQIHHMRRHIHLGLFDTPEEASAAYQVKAAELFGAFVQKVA